MNKQSLMIKEVRTKRGMTQKELSNKVFGESKAAVHSQFISNIERSLANIPTDRIVDFAKASTAPQKLLLAAILEDRESELRARVKAR